MGVPNSSAHCLLFPLLQPSLHPNIALGSTELFAVPKTHHSYVWGPFSFLSSVPGSLSSCPHSVDHNDTAKGCFPGPPQAWMLIPSVHALVISSFAFVIRPGILKCHCEVKIRRCLILFFFCKCFYKAFVCTFVYYLLCGVFKLFILYWQLVEEQTML